MKIVYKMGLNDSLTFQLFSASKSKRIINKRKRNRIIFPIIYFVTSLLFIYFKDYIAFSIIFAISVIWVFLYPIYSKKLYFNHYKKFLEEQIEDEKDPQISMWFDEEELYIETKFSTSKLSLKEIKKIYEINDYYFIFVDKRNAFTIPKVEIDIDVLNDFISNLIERTNIELIKELNWKWK